MELVELISSNRGRAATVQAHFVRPLMAEDVPYIKNPPKGLSGDGTPMLQQLRQRHHSAARLIAEGRAMNEVSAITGYSLSRLSMFKTAPDFRNLVEMYKEQKDAIFLDVHARKAELAAMVVDELKDRIEEKPASFTNRELSELLKVAADTGTSAPPQAGVAVSITFVKPEEQSSSGGVIIEGHALKE
jgi:hypothetical protein